MTIVRGWATRRSERPLMRAESEAPPSARLCGASRRMHGAGVAGLFAVLGSFGDVGDGPMAEAGP